MAQPLDFTQFAARLGTALTAESAGWASGTRLQEDLHVDSVQMLEILVLMEELGAELPDDVVASIKDLGALYDHYATRIADGER